MGVTAVQNVSVVHPYIRGAEDTLDVSWDAITTGSVVGVTSGDTSGITGYHVYRSVGKQGDKYSRLNSDLIEVSSYRDKTANQALRVQYWYKVVAENADADTGSLDDATPTIFEFVVSSVRVPRVKQIAATMVRRGRISIDPFAEDCRVYVKKVAGARCECFREGTGTYSANCTECYGTGYEGGYVRIDDQRLRIVSDQEQVRETRYGLVIEHAPQVQVAGPYPLFREGDVIVRPNNQRFLVERNRQKRFQGLVISQRLNVKELETGHPIYSLT